MKNYVTLAEAASFLCVSKATLRNWDRAGKLQAIRHPINRYRVYALADLQGIHAKLPLLASELDNNIITEERLDIRSTKRLIARLHNIQRDENSSSNIIERFDELTKLLFLKIWLDQNEPEANTLTQQSDETDSDYVARIKKLYQRISIHNPAIVPQSFAQIKSSDAAMQECAKKLSMVSFRGVDFDVKGIAYEEVIKRTFDKSEHQQFFTPPSIIKFMIEFLKEDIHGDICDPASGTGGFLVEIARSGLSYKSLTALEIDERLSWVSGINLFTHGGKNIGTVCLKNGGTLGREAEKFFGRFDTIITNPPFGSDFSEPDSLSRYILGADKTSRRRGILFLERCYYLLKERGSLGIILDEGVLNLPSALDVREFILDHFSVLGIVSLPDTAFMPYATVNASILFLKKREKSNSRHLTFFAKPENVGRKGNGDEDYIYTESGAAKLNSDFPQILALYKASKNGEDIPVSNLAYIADVHDNLKKDENGKRLDFRYHHPSRIKSQELLAKSRHRLYSLSDLCKEINFTVIPSGELQDSMILYTGLAHIESETGIARQVPTPANSLKSAVKRYEAGQIVFAKMRPNLRKVALMDFQDGGYVSPECIVLEVRTDSTGHPLIDPMLLSVFLRSELVYGQIMHLIVGIGRPRLSTKDLRQVRIPVADAYQQAKARMQFEANLQASRKIRSNASALLKQAADLEKSAVEDLTMSFIAGD